MTSLCQCTLYIHTYTLFITNEKKNPFHYFSIDVNRKCCIFCLLIWVVYVCICAMHTVSCIKLLLMWIYSIGFYLNYLLFSVWEFCSECSRWWNVNHNKSEPFTYGAVSLCEYNSYLYIFNVWIFFPLFFFFVSFTQIQLSLIYERN